MKIILEHEQDKERKEVVLSSVKTGDGIITFYVKNREGEVNNLFTLSEEGLELSVGIDPDLGFSLDEDGSLKIID